MPFQARTRRQGRGYSGGGAGRQARIVLRCQAGDRSMQDETTAERWNIRTGRDEDGPALVTLIWACWSAYSGIRMDVDAEMPELHALATYYRGLLWVAETDGTICGMIALRPIAGSIWEICRVYVDPALHGSGLA